MTEELSWIEAAWWLKASQHLTRYFRANRKRYPDMQGMREQMHFQAKVRQQEKITKVSYGTGKTGFVDYEETHELH